MTTTAEFVTDDDKRLLALHWRKSSFSGGGGPGGGNCVEVACLRSGEMAVRDSKNPNQGALLMTPPSARSLIDGVKNGQFDLPG